MNPLVVLEKRTVTPAGTVEKDSFVTIMPVWKVKLLLIVGFLESLPLVMRRL